MAAAGGAVAPARPSPMQSRGRQPHADSTSFIHRASKGDFCQVIPDICVTEPPRHVGMNVHLREPALSSSRFCSVSASAGCAD